MLSKATKRIIEEMPPKPTPSQIEREYRRMLSLAVAGALRFDDKLNGDTMQATINRAVDKAERENARYAASEYVRTARYSWDVGDGTRMSETIEEAFRSMAELRFEGVPA